MSKLVILVVEDEPLLLMAAMDMVEDAGYEALGAANSTAAMEILESRGDIAVVFTDVDMPKGRDGVWLAAQVRDRWPPISIIVTSGHRHITQDLLPPGASFLRKPYREDHVLDEIRRLAA